MMSSSLVESLESRTLFAGVIIIANGRLGSFTNDWQPDMAADITAQLGGPLQVPEYDLTVTSGNAGLQASIAHVDGTGTPQTSASGEIIVQIDYFSVSDLTYYSSTYIGQTIANCLMTTPVNGILLTSLPIHEIGVSRGGPVMDGVSQTLGQAGIWVDQETYLDPDPIAAQGDPADAIYDNVAFVDDYWRNDGSATQENDGHPVTGAYNLNVSWLDSEDAGWDTVHLAPAGYYIGTIDQTATTASDGPIYSEWYGNTPTMPARNATGWIYSDLVGAARPLSGVWAASGGTGARTAAGQVGTQWGNASDLTVTANNGDSIQVGYIYQDRDSADTATFYLDSDRNPYNNNFAANLGTFNLPQATSITNESNTLSLAGVTPGTYWLCEKIADPAGNVRYTYESITAPLTVQNQGAISGKVFNDLNGNGVQDPGEPGLPGVVVYVDLAGSGQFVPTDPSATTDANGNYTITGLPVRVPLTVGEVVSSGVQVTAAPSQPVTLTPGQTTTLPTVGIKSPATITGTVFNDLNGNGVQDLGEPGLAGRMVYLDLNGSGQYESNDPSATTDASGGYTIADVSPGAYVVGEVLPAGSHATTAPSVSLTVSAGASAAANFGATDTATISGAVVLQSVPGIATSDSPSGFEIILTQQVKGSIRRFTTESNSGGSFSFTNLQPLGMDTLRIVRRKGFKLARHAHGTYRFHVADSQLISGLVFSEVPIVPRTRSAKAAG